MSEQPVPDSILDLEEVEIESLAMDADEVARRLLAARGSEAPTPDEGPG